MPIDDAGHEKALDTVASYHLGVVIFFSISQVLQTLIVAVMLYNLLHK